MTYLDLRDYPLPLYEEDYERERGTPENARRLKELFRQHEGFLIASPEHNGSFPALLKNVIDWVSRPVPGEPPLAVFRGKTAAIAAASPGQWGGVRGLKQLRELLQNISVNVLPEQVALGNASEAFGPRGELANKAQQQGVEDFAASLVAALSVPAARN